MEGSVQWMGIILNNLSKQQYDLSYNLKKEPDSYAAYLLACFCMPVLLQMKPSSLIPADPRYMKDRISFLQTLVSEIKPFGCRFAMIYEDRQVFLLLIYHERKLTETLTKPENRLFLEAWGYPTEGNVIEDTLDKLKERYQGYQSLRDITGDRDILRAQYPHEIGVVLGYPLEDVKDFIRYRGSGYLICGCWKVYHDAENARRIFEKYRFCRPYILIAKLIHYRRFFLFLIIIRI
jgi:hypothetical protein